MWLSDSVRHLKSWTLAVYQAHLSSSCSVMSCQALEVLNTHSLSDSSQLRHILAVHAVSWAVRHLKSWTVRHNSAAHSLSGTSQQFMQCHELSGTWSLEHSQFIRLISAQAHLSSSCSVMSCQALEVLNCQAHLSSSQSIRHISAVHKFRQSGSCSSSCRVCTVEKLG